MIAVVEGEAMEPVDGHACLLPFDTDDPEFARGFEAGRIWTILHGAPEEEVEEIVHAANAEMALRMADRLGRRAQSTELGDDWLAILFGPAGVEAPADLQEL
jgi:hypothetical protein